MQKSSKLPAFYKGQSRRSNGKYVSRREKNFILVIFATLFFMSLISWNSFEDTKLHSMLYPEVLFSQPVPEVRAVDGEIESTSSSAPQIEPSIEDRIRMRFGKHGDIAVKIARCESGIRAEAVGDKTLTFTKGGKTYGDSHGMFQIRHLPGRPSVEDLHDVNTNIEEAWKISKGGTNWGAWVTCSRKAGV